MPREWEVVGVIDSDVADAMPTQDEIVLVEHEDPEERLVCAPKE